MLFYGLKCYFQGGIVWNPTYFRILAIPGKLSLCEAPGISLDKRHGCLEVCLAIQIGEELLIPHGLQGVQVAVGQERSYFIQQAFLHHGIYPGFDALVDNISGGFNTQRDMYKPLGSLSLAQIRAVRTTTRNTYFQSPDQPSGNSLNPQPYGIRDPVGIAIPEVP